MHNIKSILIMFFLAVTSSSAQSFKILGTRSLGMGGAGVALAQGEVSQYWNPAGLALRKGMEVEIPFGIGAELTQDLLKEANDLAHLAPKISAIQNKTIANTDALTLAQYQDFLNALVQINELNKEGLGVLVELQGGANIRIGPFAVSYNNFTEVGADPFVDTVNMGLSGGSFGTGLNAVFNDGSINGSNPGVNPTDQANLAAVITDMNSKLGLNLPGSASNIANELIFNASTAGGGTLSSAEISQAVSKIQELYNQAITFLPGGVNPFAANQTNLTLRGASVGEVAIGAGRSFFQENAFLKRFSVGANVKILRGEVGYAKLNILEKSVQVKDLYKDFTNNLKTSIAFGVDLGILYDMQDTRAHCRWGVVARNVNRPEFDQPQAGKDAGLRDYSLDPQVRAGGAWRPLNWMTVVADVDLTNNSTSLPGYKSRQVGGGLEINVFNRSWLNLALRGGLLKNIAEKESSLAYTAGLGLNLLHVCFDVGAALSSKSVKIDTGDQIPSSLRAAANLGVRF